MIVVRTPLRLSFAGGGSDIRAFYEKNEGRVVSSAVDKFVYVIVKGRFDEKIYINYSKKECVDSVDEIQHDLVREAMRITGVDRGVEITTLADIPSEGSGLGSSSSITVALLHALHTYNEVLPTAEQLAREACRIEIEILKKPIGRQDQYAAAYGGINEFIFNPDDSVTRIPVRLDGRTFRKISSSLLLYFTGITRSADVILREQSGNYQKQDKTAVMREMAAMTGPFRRALEAGDIEAMGGLLDQGWRKKQAMASGISNQDIGEMYGLAMGAGALGGKVAGAGGGGFLMLLAPRDRQADVFAAMSAYRELPFMLEPSGSRVIFDHRGYSIK